MSDIEVRKDSLNWQTGLVIIVTNNYTWGGICTGCFIGYTLGYWLTKWFLNV